MSIIRGIKVGTTTITSVYSDGNDRSDSKEFTVTAVSLSSISKPSNTVYTGSPIEPIVSVTAIVNGISTTLTVNEDYLLTYSNNTNAGTATVTATGINNFTGSVSQTWTITGAEITVSADDQSYDYDGLYHGSPVSASTVGNNAVTITYNMSEPSGANDYPLTTAPQIRNVADSGIVYFKVTAPNHLDYTGTYSLEVGAKEATLSWGTTSWVFDGTEHHTTCVVTNLESGDTCNVILSGNTITNIGSTVVTATGLSNSNYTLPSDANVLSVTLSVSPGLFVKLSGTWTPVKEVYKRISGVWVKQAMESSFSTSEKYIKMN